MTRASHIHLDMVGGIAGDMFVAALLDAFPDLRDGVLADIRNALPTGIGEPKLEEGASSAIRCLRFGLDVHAAVRKKHDHGHAHGGHHHGHDHDHAHYRDLAARIRAAELSPGTADNACAILHYIAEAEARIHNVPIEDVHFHELADWDSLMDVVAAGSIVAALPNTKWSFSDLPLGGGTVHTQHGTLPVPAPATAEMLKDFAWRDDGIAGERVTPTGAGILRHLAARQGRSKGGRLSVSGTGAGIRELVGMPNILRALVFTETARPTGKDNVAVLSFDVDDMTGEEIGIATERLRVLPGVRDLSLVALTGKKGRPAQGFRLLVEPAALDEVKEHCFLETSTIGLRWHMEEREVLQRESLSVAGSDRTLRIKKSHRPGGGVTTKIESDDLSAHGTLGERRSLKGRHERESSE